MIDWEVLYSGNSNGVKDARIECSRLSCKVCGGLQEGCICPVDEDGTPLSDYPTVPPTYRATPRYEESK